MKLWIKIECENGAFYPDPSIEIKRILENLERAVWIHGAPITRKLHDLNGNTVGYAEWSK